MIEVTKIDSKSIQSFFSAIKYPMIAKSIEALQHDIEKIYKLQKALESIHALDKTNSKN
jgi:hypothetical protein